MAVNPLLQYKNEYVNLIKQSDFKGLDALTDSLVDKSNGHLGFLQLKEQVLELAVCVYKDVVPIRTMELYNDNTGVENMYQLKSWLNIKLKNAASGLHEESLKQSGNPVALAINYIMDYYMEDLSLDIVANKANISPNYLCRRFRQETGENFVDYVTNVRISKARELLAYKRFTAKEVAKKVGYSNHTYFSKLFKKATGKTVAEYRKTL